MLYQHNEFHHENMIAIIIMCIETICTFFSYADISSEFNYKNIMSFYFHQMFLIFMYSIHLIILMVFLKSIPAIAYPVNLLFNFPDQYDDEIYTK